MWWAKINSIVLSHDSTRLALASNDGTIEIWNVNSNSSECLHMLKDSYSAGDPVDFLYYSTQLVGHIKDVNSVAFSHDSTRLASASNDGTVKIWDVGGASGESLHTLESHRHGVTSVAFSHDLTRLASGSADRTIKIWDAASTSGECLCTLEGHGLRIHSVTFSHDSTRLASISDDYKIKIWDTSNATGECLHTLNYQASGFVYTLVAFSHDLTLLASTKWDIYIGIWDVISGKCLWTYGDCSRDQLIPSMAFSPDSRWLALGSDCVRIWDMRRGMCLQTFGNHKLDIKLITFSHDSRRLASSSGDGTINIWCAGSGHCLHTLSINKTIFCLSFNTTGSCLHTNLGTIAINASSASNTKPSVTDSQNPLYQGWGICPKGAWITYNSENAVWLPSEYRPEALTVSGNTIGIGVGSGKVWMCSFDKDNFEAFRSTH